MGVNNFADKTDDEIKEIRGTRRAQEHLKKYSKEEESYPKHTIPKSMDWRMKGIITPIKDQGRCGSCWSFSSTETVESYFALLTGLLTTLSEEQILDCTPNPNECGGTGGCGGGTVELAYSRIAVMGGLSSEWTYPYTSYFGDNHVCNSTRVRPMLTVPSYVNLPSNVLSPVLNHVGNKGPLAITVDASAWSFYETGVFDGCNQTNPDLDHGVQLIGYGTDQTYGDYWLVRNSWSPFWGESGYIRLKRTASPRCGWDLTPLDGDACRNNTAPELVCGTCGILYDALYPVVAKK